MKKIMICMAFFGMLIGNGHAGVGGGAPAVTDNATELLNALNCVTSDGSPVAPNRCVGNILDKLRILNTDTKEGAVTAKKVYDDKSNTYKDLKDKLVEKNGFAYDDTKGHYYLIGDEKKLNGFEALVIENITKGFEEVFDKSMLSVQEKYIRIVEGGFYIDSTKCEQFRMMIRKDVTCASNNAEKNVRETMGKICKAINTQVKNKRIELLKKLLNEIILEKINDLRKGEDKTDVKKYVKEYNDAYFGFLQADKELVANMVDIEKHTAYINILKGEVTEQLLSDVMDENKKAYNERIKYLDSIAKPAKVVTTTSPSGGSGGKPSVTPTVKKGSAAAKVSSIRARLHRK